MGRKRRHKQITRADANPNSDRPTVVSDDWSRSRTGQLVGLFLASSLVLSGCSQFRSNAPDPEQEQPAAGSAGYYSTYYRSGMSGLYPHSYVQKNTARLMSHGLMVSKGGLGNVGRSAGG